MVEFLGTIFKKIHKCALLMLHQSCSIYSNKNFWKFEKAAVEGEFSDVVAAIADIEIDFLALTAGNVFMELRAAFLGANVVEIVDIEAFVHADAFKVFVFIIETMKYVEGNGLKWTYLAYYILHIVYSGPLVQCCLDMIL